MKNFLSKKKNFKKLVFIASLFLGLFLPHTTVAAQFVHGILPLVLIMSVGNFKAIGINKFSILIIVIVALSFVLNVFLDTSIENKAVMRLFSLCTLFLFFPFVTQVTIPNWALYSALAYILISQFAYVLGISPLVSFFDSFYPYYGETESFKTEYLMSGAGDVDFIKNRRYGGLYHNPNQAVRYISVLLAVFLIENKNYRVWKKLPFIGLVLISVSLSGSRTGFLVTLILLIGNYLFLDIKKIKFTTILPILTIVGVLVVGYLSLSNLDLRIFNIAEGVESSLGSKVEWFLKFL